MSGAFLLHGAALWTAAGLAFLLWLAAAAFERRRSSSRRRHLVRLALLGIVCAALFLLAAQPRRWARLRGGEAVLLTSGATAGDLAAAAAAGLPAWAVPPAPGEPPPPAGAAQLPDAAALVRLHGEVTALRVAGHGLAAWELRELPLRVAASAPPPLPFGVARIAWQRRLTLGETLEVAGVAAGVPAPGGTVRVVAPAIAESAVRVGPGTGPFRLRARPRGPGRHLLELRLEAPGRQARVELLDLEVVPEPPPAVLWLEAAPTAEGREVKRWLAAAGGAFAWRAQVSRGLARDEVAGLPALPRGPLGAALLRRFDLVVADGRALAALGAGERVAIGAAVRDDGLGLLLRAGDATAPAAFGVSFPLRPLPGGGELSARLAWEDGDSTPLALRARELVADGALVPFAADRAGRVLAAWRPLGRGAVGVSLVDDSWRWVLAGHAEDHRRYWRRAIAALARPATPVPRWEAAAGPLLAGLPGTVTFAGEPPPAATVRPPGAETLELPLRQDADEPSRWTATFWPRHPGWHQVGEGAAAAHFWVAPPERWTTWRLAARQEATALRQAAPPAARAAAASTVRRRAPLPRLPLFALLLAALGALWADEQLGPRRPRTAID